MSLFSSKLRTIKYHLRLKKFTTSLDRRVFRLCSPLTFYSRSLLWRQMQIWNREILVHFWFSCQITYYKQVSCGLRFYNLYRKLNNQFTLVNIKILIIYMYQKLLYFFCILLYTSIKKFINYHTLLNIYWLLGWHVYFVTRS